MVIGATLSEIFDAIFVEFAVWTYLGIFGAIVTTVLAYFRSVKQCQIKTSEDVDKLSKRTFRQSKALLSMASAIDKQTNRLHEDEDSTLLEDIQRDLEDENGNL